MTSSVCFSLIFISCLAYGFAHHVQFSNKSFPRDFKFGVASSAYQVEGAWNIDGKGENIWDHLLHNQPNFTKDSSNGDVACDFYHKYRDDIANLKDLGVHYFRFSISWSRILPFGTIDYINWKAVDHYRSLITELLENGIEPMVTIYHWDMPQILQDRGGFLNNEFVEWFGDFSRFLYHEFGDKIKIWATFNEPIIICSWGYGQGQSAPALKGDGQLDYICAHNLLKAHARAYHIYDDEYRSSQQGQVSIVLMSPWVDPASSNLEDIEAAERALQFQMGWFANPIYVGDYPEIMKSRIAKRSYLEGRSSSRLPKFSPEEIDYIRGTYDYFGLNHYTTQLASNQPEAPVDNGPGYFLDMGVNLTFSEKLATTCVVFLKVFLTAPADSAKNFGKATVVINGTTVHTALKISVSKLLHFPSKMLHLYRYLFRYVKVAPFSMRRMLVFVKERYNNPTIYITESGSCNFGGLKDDDHIFYMKSYMSNVLDAILMYKVRVVAYIYWSFLDSFEWGSGNTAKFGLIQVDLSDPNLPRTPKKSALAYKKIVKTHCLVEGCK